MSRSGSLKSNPDEAVAVSPTTTDAEDLDVKKMRDEYALNPIGSGSSKSSKSKNGHLRLSSNSTDGGGDDDAARIIDRSQEVENASIENGDRESVVYKVYKRRWFGLVQLTLLNIIVSWDVSFKSHLVPSYLATLDLVCPCLRLRRTIYL